MIITFCGVFFRLREKANISELHILSTDLRFSGAGELQSTDSNSGHGHDSGLVSKAESSVLARESMKSQRIASP